MVEWEKLVELLKIHGQKLVVGIVGVLVIGALFFQWLSKDKVQPESVDEWLVAENNADSEWDEINQKQSQADEELPIIYIDIKGAVHDPGVYQFEEGDRLLDAVEKAGGLTSDADERQINMAQKLVDQMMIIIPVIGEEITPAMNGLSADLPSTETDQVNINTADIEELKTLTGIGEAKARNIIEYREMNGSFQTTDEIKNVSGIGDGIFTQIKDAITVK